MDTTNLSARQLGYIAKARETHGDKYTYTKLPTNWLDENGKRSRIEYTCNACGEHMDQALTLHLNAGQGCRVCNKPTGGRGNLKAVTFLQNGDLVETPATLYIAKLTPRDGTTPFIKVGVTTQKLTSRYVNLRYHSKCVIETLHAVTGGYLHMYCLEQWILTNADKHKVENKWWGSSELIKVDTDYMALLADYNARSAV